MPNLRFKPGRNVAPAGGKICYTIARMLVVASQYWNSVHGNAPKEIVQDLEGLQTMRTLGDNMAWILKCIAAGKAAGIEPPTSGPWVATNFIR